MMHESSPTSTPSPADAVIAGVLDAAQPGVLPIALRAGGDNPGAPLGRYGEFTAPDGHTVFLPLPNSAAAGALVARLAGTLARIHTASEPFARDPALPGITLAAHMDHVRQRWFRLRRTIGEAASAERDIRRWLRCGNRLIPTASDLLRNEEALLLERSVLTHGQLWPSNVFTIGHEDAREITALLGWEHATAGSPVQDLAALTVHMHGWSAALTEAIVESYTRERTLLPQQRRLIPAVAALELIDQSSDLLMLVYLDDRMLRHPAHAVARSGLKTLLSSMESLTAVLAPDIEQTERRSAARSRHRVIPRPGMPGRRFEKRRNR